MRISRKILLSFLIGLCLVPLFLFKVRGNMKDFSVNYTAGLRLRYGESLYRVEDEHYQFKYLPSSALIYAPLSHLPLDAAKFIWFLGIALSLTGMAALSYRLTGHDFGTGIGPWRLLALLVLAKFFLREIQLGQINALIGFLLILMIKLLSDPDREKSGPREVGAGALWGLAVALKPYAFLFFPYLVVKGKGKSLVSGLAVIGALLLAPAYYYGWGGNRVVLKEWAATLSASTPTLLTSQDNVSIPALFMKWTGSRTLSLWGTGAALGLLGIGILIIIRRGKHLPHPVILEGGILLTCIPLVSPLGWDYTLLVSVLMLMHILNHWDRYSKGWRILLALDLGIIALSMYDLLGKATYARFMSWSVITVAFLGLLGYGAFLRVKGLE